LSSEREKGKNQKPEAAGLYAHFREKTKQNTVNESLKYAVSGRQAV